MTSLKMSLHILNAFEFPKESEAFNAEFQRMSSNLEDGQTFTEEEVFLVAGFETDFTGVDGDLQQGFYRATLRTLSEDFPNLVFVMDVSSVDADGEVGQLIRREYFNEGQRQAVFPYLVVPEYDPEGAFE